MNESINSRQIGILCAISMFALKLIELPALLYEKSKTTGLFIGIMMAVIDTLTIFIYLKLKQKYPKQSLYDLITKILGKLFANIVYILFFIFFLLKFILLINEAGSYIKAIVDEDYTVIMFLITFLPVTTALGYGTLRNFARTCEFGIIFIYIGIIVCLLFSEIDLTYNNLGSIFEYSNTIMQSAFDVCFWFSDFVFILIILDKIEFDSKTIKSTYFYVWSLNILLIFLIIIYYNLFDNTAFLHQNAIADITSFNRNIGNSGNIDIISILLYLFSAYFLGGLYTIVLKTIYTKVLPYKNNNIHSLIFIDIVVVFLQLFIFFNLELIIEFSINYSKYLVLFLFVFVILFSLGLFVFDKNGGKYDKKVYKKTYKYN